jgi:hypothetical protein
VVQWVGSRQPSYTTGYSNGHRQRITGRRSVEDQKQGEWVEYRRRPKTHDTEKAIVIMSGVFYRKRRAKGRTATAFLAAATFG